MGAAADPGEQAGDKRMWPQPYWSLDGRGRGEVCKTPAWRAHGDGYYWGQSPRLWVISQPLVRQRALTVFAPAHPQGCFERGRSEGRLAGCQQSPHSRSQGPESKPHAGRGVCVERGQHGRQKWRLPPWNGPSARTARKPSSLGQKTEAQTLPYTGVGPTPPWSVCPVLGPGRGGALGDGDHGCRRTFLGDSGCCLPGRHEEAEWERAVRRATVRLCDCTHRHSRGEGPRGGSRQGAGPGAWAPRVACPRQQGPRGPATLSGAWPAGRLPGKWTRDRFVVKTKCGSMSAGEGDAPPGIQASREGPLSPWARVAADLAPGTAGGCHHPQPERL